MIGWSMSSRMTAQASLRCVTDGAVAAKTATLTETELAQYCRKKDLDPEQISQWKQGFLQVTTPDDKASLKQSQKRIKQLEKELVPKEKALAEAAAILVLRKRLQDYYGETDGDD